MTIQEIWGNFGNSMTDIVLSQRASKDIFNAEYKRILDYEKMCEENEHDIDAFPSLHNMFFTCVASGNNIFYGHRSINIEEKKALFLKKKNRQYQFLLMEAYELFEKTIVDIYAFLGKNTRDIWQMSEYGNIKPNELEEKEFSFFQDCARKRKKGPIGITKTLLNHFQCNIEENGFELLFYIILCEKIRHITVHNYGKISNRDEFIESVAKDCGKYNNGKIEEKIVNQIGYFLFNLDGEVIVNLTEHVDRTFSAMPFEYSRYSLLTDKLLNCIHLLCTEIVQDTP